MKFGYASSRDAVKMLQRDIGEARICFKNQVYKATMLMCGSVLELALLDCLQIQSKDAEASYSKIFGSLKPLEEWKLFEMLKVSNDLGLISGETFKLSDLLRDYRNLIHPSVELRKSMEPNRERAERSLRALSQILKELDRYFEKIGREILIIDVNGIPGRWISNTSNVRLAIEQTARSKGVNTTHIGTLDELDTLVRKPPSYAIVINTHGEVIPIPPSWNQNWRNYFIAFGNAVKEKGWIFVSIAGYPFWAYDVGKECFQDGLNSFLSVVNAGADCMRSSPVEFTDEGLKALRRFNMKGLSMRLVANRCADWQGISPDKVFLKSGKLCGSSAIRIGRGWFIQMGFDPSLGIRLDEKTGETILGNLALAFAFCL